MADASVAERVAPTVVNLAERLDCALAARKVSSTVAQMVAVKGDGSVVLLVETKAAPTAASRAVRMAGSTAVASVAALAGSSAFR